MLHLSSLCLQLSWSAFRSVVKDLARWPDFTRRSRICFRYGVLCVCSVIVSLPQDSKNIVEENDFHLALATTRFAPERTPCDLLNAALAQIVNVSSRGREVQVSDILVKGLDSGLGMSQGYTPSSFLRRSFVRCLTTSKGS